MLKRSILQRWGREENIKRCLLFEHKKKHILKSSLRHVSSDSFDVHRSAWGDVMDSFPRVRLKITLKDGWTSFEQTDIHLQLRKKHIGRLPSKKDWRDFICIVNEFRHLLIAQKINVKWHHWISMLHNMPCPSLFHAISSLRNYW